MLLVSSDRTVRLRTLVAPCHWQIFIVSGALATKRCRLASLRLSTGNNSGIAACSFIEFENEDSLLKFVDT
jgi:hypothetical protein